MARPELIQQIYRDYLGREADPSGLEYWSSVDASDDEIRNHILNAAQGSDRTAVIQSAYQSELGRAADPTGLNYWQQSSTPGSELAGNIGYASQFPTVNQPAEPPSDFAGEMMQSPSYQMFMAGLGLDAGQAEDMAQLQKDLAMERMRKNSESYPIQLARQQAAINQNFESRGMSRSGARHTAVNRAAADSDRAQSIYEANAQSDIASNYRNTVDRGMWEGLRNQALQDYKTSNQLTEQSVRYTG